MLRDKPDLMRKIIDDDIRAGIKEMGGVDLPTEPDEFGNPPYRLVADGRTRRDAAAGRPLTYQVIIYDQNGAPTFAGRFQMPTGEQAAEAPAFKEQVASEGTKLKIEQLRRRQEKARRKSFNPKRDPKERAEAADEAEALEAEIEALREQRNQPTPTGENAAIGSPLGGTAR